MDRRRFLKSSLVLSALVAGTSSYSFLYDTSFDEGLDVEGYLKADLHVHLHRGEDKSTLRKVLSKGLVALAVKQASNKHLRYEDVLELRGAKEIDKGVLAQVEYGNNVGYVLKAQELISHDHVIVAGIESYIDEDGNFENSMREAERQGAVKILAHPYLVNKERGYYPLTDPLSPVGKADTEAEERRIREHMDQVDEFELFNGMSNDLFFGKFAFREANEKARKLLQEYPHMRGIACSDTHSLTRDVLSSNIYIPFDEISRDSLISRIKEHDFRLGQMQYIRRLDMIQSMLL